MLGRVVVPPGVVTVTVTRPADLAGAVTVTLVEVLAVIVASVPPNVTDVAPARFVPVMVTDIPPLVGPDDGDTVLILGTGT